MAASQTEVTKAIRAANAEFERIVRAQNAPQLVETAYVEDAVLLPPNQPMLSGRAKIAEFWQGMFGAGLRDASLETVQVDFSGGLASEIGKYTLTIQPAGAQPIQAQGKYLVAWRQQADGAWKLTADMFSSDT